MATPPSERFRSAAEFPKTIETFDSAEANQLYQEMRDCLIYTNRSRAQLVRRNDEHKLTAQKLKSDVDRLQFFITQLSSEKQQLTVENQKVVAELQQEITSMAGYLDQLSDAFEPMANVEMQGQSQWSFMSMPNRFFSFLRAVKAIVMWWREEKDDNAVVEVMPQKSLTPAEIDQDRKDNPQMYDDPASQGRSLLDR